MIVKNNAKLLLIHQLNHFYIWGGVSQQEEIAVNHIYQNVLGYLDKCFSHIKNKYYHKGGETFFNPLHVAQWTMFLYQMAYEIKRVFPENTDLCDKIYGISKCFSSADIFYEAKMPEIWFFDHPQGSVMGRAEYSNFFSFTQGCTVGNNKGIYPKFGEHVSMMSGSKVLGNCCIGDHVIFAANSYIIDQDIPPYSIVFGSGRDAVIHPISLEKFNMLTNSIFIENNIVL